MVEGETRALRRKEYSRKVLGTYSTSKHHNGVLSANRCMFEISSYAERRMNYRAQVPSLGQLLPDTRKRGGSALSRQWLLGAGAWLSTHGVKSSSLHEGRRCRSMRECVRGFRRSTCPGPLPSSVRECVRGVRHTAGKMRRGIKS